DELHLARVFVLRQVVETELLELLAGHVAVWRPDDDRQGPEVRAARARAVRVIDGGRAVAVAAVDHLPRARVLGNLAGRALR
ncbi:hypothetical protein EU79_15020, partial [Staphylococcus aureus]